MNIPRKLLIFNPFISISQKLHLLLLLSLSVWGHTWQGSGVTRFCALESFLDGSGDYIGCQGSNSEDRTWVGLHARQATSPLYCLSAPENLILFVHMCVCMCDVCTCLRKINFVFTCPTEKKCSVFLSIVREWEWGNGIIKYLNTIVNYDASIKNDGVLGAEGDRNFSKPKKNVFLLTRKTYYLLSRYYKGKQESWRHLKSAKEIDHKSGNCMQSTQAWCLVS